MKNDNCNILLIISDQLSADALSISGNPFVKTPNIDRLALRGLRFEKAYCAFPKCVPSRTSLLYGRMPHEIMLPGTELDYGAKVGDPDRGVIPEHRKEELGKLLSSAGYDCVYAGKWHVGQWGPTESLEEGFDSGFRSICGINDPETPEACGEYVRQSDPKKPFFMVASFDNPHNICEWAWDEPLPWGNLPDPPPLRELPSLPGNHYQAEYEPPAIRAMRRRIRERQGWSAAEWRQYRWAYFRLVEKVDARIGCLLDYLDRSGLGEDTVVIFTSDHGDMQSSHGLVQKDTFYDEAARVPFILSIPGGPAGETSCFPVNNALDTYASILDFAGVEAPGELNGISLRSLTDAEDSGREFVAGELKYRFGLGEARMVRSGQFKYILHEIGPCREQLFDMEKDPGEMENLAVCKAYSETVRRHRAYLREWLEKTGDPMGSNHYCHPDIHIALPDEEYIS